MYFLITFILVALVFHFWIRLRRLRHSGEFISNQFDETTLVLESLHDGLIELDSQMIPVRINHAVEIMLGVEASTIVNRNVELGVSSTPIDKTLASIIYSPKGSGESYDVFLPAPHNLKLRIFTIPKNNPRTKVQTGYIKILRDVTIETVVEQHKNDLISIVSHQLLTPLTGMKWIFKSLVAGDMGPLAPKQEDILKKGSEANEGMIDLVTDILDTAKVEQARFTYKIELSNIVATCHEVVVSRQEKAVTRSVTMVESYAIMEKVLKYDAERMNIALSNIIDNALDYSQKGSKIEVKIAPLLDGVTISIADHGIGIPEKAMARIFSKFYRAENAKRVRTSGTGLGLYLTKHIIEDHGGKIDINSKEGEGTTITVTLPGNLGVASIGHGNVASI